MAKQTIKIRTHGRAKIRIAQNTVKANNGKRKA